MTTELRDLRAKVTVETDAVLDSQAKSSGKDRSEIVREVLHAWALDRIHEGTLLNARLKAEGLGGLDGESHRSTARR